MSASLHLATPQALPRLVPMIAAFQEQLGAPRDEGHISAALAPLLDGAQGGVVYLIGPARAPVGYVLISFGWSIAAGGMTCTLEHIYIRDSIRGRGMGSEVLIALPKALAEGGVCAMFVTVPPAFARAASLFKRLRFAPQDSADAFHLDMT